MSAQVVMARRCLPDEEVARLEGEQLGEDSYDLLIAHEEVTVLKPDGSPLVAYRPGVLKGSRAITAYDVFSKVPVGSRNRGMAAGLIDPSARRINGHRIASVSGSRYKAYKADGTISNTNYAVEAPSATIGYLDRSPRNNYCRKSAFNLRHPERFKRALPFIRDVNAIFRETLPDRYRSQFSAIETTQPDFTVHDTAFTTITVNHDWPTAVHQDKGDLRAGFGVMSVLDAGEYDGCYLVFPKFGVAVDMRWGGVCLADVHEYHGNTPIIGRPSEFQRVSLVFYYREGMMACGSAEDEHLRALAIAPSERLASPSKVVAEVPE